MQTVDATPFRGKRVRFRSYARAGSHGFASQSQVWLRVETPDGPGFFDNIEDRPIVGTEWQAYEIVGDVDEDARSISFGFALRRHAIAWFDDVTLEAIPGSRIVNEPGRAFGQRGLENVMAFARLYGYVRYFHPSDEAATVNWHQFVVNNISQVEKARNSGELATSLQALFRPVAPTLRIFRKGRKSPLPLELLPAALKPKVIFWSHDGYGWGDLGKTYRSERVIGDLNSDHDPRKVFIGDLGRGLTASLPLALWHAAEKADHPNKGLGTTNLAIPPSTARDRATRIGAVIIAWNIFQHFYPYFDVVETNWSQVLKTSLQRAAVDTDNQSFLKTLRLLAAQLHDSHAYVYHPLDSELFGPPINWQWIENQPVVTHVDKGIQGIHLGDVILSIDGRPTTTVLQEREQLLSGATKGGIRWYAVLRLAQGSENTEVAFELESMTGQRYATTLVRSVPFDGRKLREATIDKITEVKPGIWYVDYMQLTEDELESSAPKLQNAKGIVFDFRGYPRAFKFLGHLTEASIVSPQWQILHIDRPNREHVSFKSESWSIEPASPRIRSKNVFLIGPRDVSAGETLLGFVSHYKLGKLVGQQTAGTNGNINRVMLPGGFVIQWTGMRVLKQDGSQHHGIGYLPDVPASRTRKGVAEGRDEVLEEGIKVVNALVETSS
jgi:C-terminal processing protease CtpA/Prc